MWIEPLINVRGGDCRTRITDHSSPNGTLSTSDDWSPNGYPNGHVYRDPRNGNRTVWGKLNVSTQLCGPLRAGLTGSIHVETQFGVRYRVESDLTYAVRAEEAERGGYGQRSVGNSSTERGGALGTRSSLRIDSQCTFRAPPLSLPSFMPF